MKHLTNPAWLLILFGLVLSTIGWTLKLNGYPQADACIVAGTGLVLLFGALALWQLVRLLDTGLRGPLGLLAASLLVLLLATADFVAEATLTLALVGGLLAAGGTAWLLVRLNHTWDHPATSRRHKYPTA